MADVLRISPESTAQTRITQDDFNKLADWVVAERRRRKELRKDLEKQWTDIDRQLRMKPNVSHKLMANGQADTARAWMAETELPFQAQTLETLTADSRRLKFPQGGAPWFQARAALTDEYLARFESAPPPTGGTNDPPSLMDQDNADKLATALVSHWHRQYDFPGFYDLIDGEAFKYGVGVGRMRKVTKQVVRATARGHVRETQSFPVLLPRSIKHTYLDDRAHMTMNEGHLIGPTVIFEASILLADLRMAAAKGNADPHDEERGGWKKDSLGGLMADKNGQVSLYEAEGDLLMPRNSGEDLFIPGAIVTVAVGTGGTGGTEGSIAKVIRFRFRDSPYLTYLLHPYHGEDMNNPYATSPLMKGWSVQLSASRMLGHLADSGMLNVLPPISFDRDDHVFAAEGGPQLYPGAQMASTGEIQVHKISDPQALLAVFSTLVQLYYDVVGVAPPRLGAQTTSHTTAFAKDAELFRGQVRTVDYVQSSLDGPMTQLLNQEYIVGRALVPTTGKMAVYVDSWNDFVFLRRAHLPDLVVFQALGASTELAEERTRSERFASAQAALQIDNVAVQLGRQPRINHGKLVEQILRTGGWNDVDIILTPEQPAAAAGGGGVAQGPAAGPAVPGGGGSSGIITSGDPILDALP